MPNGGWKEYFVFTKRERVAVIVLLAIMAIFITFSYCYTPIFSSPVIDKEVQDKLTALSQSNSSPIVNQLQEQGDSSAAATTKFANFSKPKKEQFFFDPNTLSVEGWKRLGFRDKTIANILHYREAAGKFEKPKDLYKVPRIRKKAVAAVLPFIRIGLPITVKNRPPTPAGISNSHTYKILNINTAAAEEFMVFPGITTPVAHRIIKFRASIQGFKSVEDVAKTYGLPDSTFSIMRPYLTISPK